MTTVIVTQPIAKLYKRCAWGKHDQCPGSFQSWSVCSCLCHLAAEVIGYELTVEEIKTAVAEAEVIVCPPSPAITRSAPSLEPTARVEKAPRRSKQYESTGLPGPDLPRN